MLHVTNLRTYMLKDLLSCAVANSNKGTKKRLGLVIWIIDTFGSRLLKNTDSWEWR